MLNKKAHKAVGKIYREYGLKGHCRFYSYSGGNENLFVGRKYVLENLDRDALTVKIQSVMPAGRYYHVHFDAFDTPEDMIPWRKAVLWLDRKSFIFDLDEKFNFDWQGFLVLDSSGKKIGVIEDIVQNPLRQFSVKTAENKNFLIPFVKEWIVDVDKTRALVKINFPEGLIE